MVIVHTSCDIIDTEDLKPNLECFDEKTENNFDWRRLCFDHESINNMYRIYYDAGDMEPLLKRRNDREEIRKKLAMDSDTEDYYCGERVTRKPSLSTRLQSGMNLQICFMNETASDQESQNSDHDTDSGHSDLNSTNQRTPSPIGDRISSCFNSDLSTSPLVLHCEEDSQTTSSSNSNNSNHRLISSVSEKNSLNSQNVSNGNATSNNKKQRPSFFFARQKSWRLRPKQKSTDDQEEKGTSSQDSGRFDPTEDFYTRHARLQAEARMALAQAKEMARMQMEVERQKSKKSPIADIVGLPFPDNRHRLSRQILTDMNVAQLQVIVNDLHTQIENLNEDLVQLLLTRDDLHMEQDSMLVDIEDLTRYFRAKDEAQQQQPVSAALCKSSSKK